MSKPIPKSVQEKVMDFREAFIALPAQYQSRELSRLNRIAEGNPPIFAEPLDDHTRRFKFNSPTELIKYLRLQGIEVNSNSNIYKCLRGERKSAHGHRIYYGKD